MFAALRVIAYYSILGKPVILITGVATFLSFLMTAAISISNRRGIHVIPFKWHARIAIFSLVLGIIHGLFGLSQYF